MRSLRALVPAVLFACACGPDPLPPVVPAPKALAPALGCSEQLTMKLSLTGTGFSNDAKDGAAAKVVLARTKEFDGGDSTFTFEVPKANQRWADATTLEISLGPDVAPGPGLYDVEVTNANGQKGTLAGALLLAPPPRVNGIGTRLVAGELGGNVDVQGDGFLLVGDAKPKVAVGTLVLDAAKLDQCRDLPGTSGAKACKVVTVAVPAGATVPGVPRVAVTNPEPAACVSNQEVKLAVVASPIVTKVEPDALCAAQGGTITVTGKEFLKFDGQMPSVRVGSVLAPATSVEGCQAIAAIDGVEKCTTVVAALPAGQVSEGALDVNVLNGGGSLGESHEHVTLGAVGKPFVLNVTPAAVCTAAGGRIVVEGLNFLRIGGVAPEVTVAGNVLAAEADGCEATQGATSAETCARLLVDVPASLLAAGPALVVVKNPAPADCTGDAANLPLVSPPTITDVSATTVCGQGAVLTLTGTDFRPGSTVTIDGVAATSTVVTGATTATATFGALAAGGPYDVALKTPESCEAVVHALVSVAAGPEVAFVEPSVVPDDLSVTFTAWGRDLSAGFALAELLGPGGAKQSLTSELSISHPARARWTAGPPLAAGSWSVHLRDTSGCDVVVPGVITSVGSRALSVNQVSPPFAAKGTRPTISMTITGAAFTGLPRAYFHLRSGLAGNATPMPLDVVAPDRATGTLLANLPAGIYDLELVNGDGTVGAKQSAFVVVNNPAPRLDAIVPSVVTNAGTQQFTVQGANVRQPLVGLTCTVAGGATQSASATVVSSTSDSVTASFNAASFGAGASCTVRVTNGDESSYADIPGLVVTTATQALGTPSPGPALGTARRALGVASARFEGARWLFAIGGDAGTEASALATVESASLDSAGNPGGWTTQRTRLTTPRTYVAAATVGRFVYAIGGDAGSGALATVERAAILDSANRPAMSDAELTPGTAGLGAGAWSYRVSAVLDASDAANPGGETLPSDRWSVQLPDLGARRVAPTLSWTALPNAAKYRVFRTAQAGATTEVLVGETTATTFTDTGLAAGTETPLAKGALGKWHAVASLNTARRGAAAVAAQDPASAGTWHLYAIGGQDSAGNVLDSYEHLTIGADGTPGTWTTGSAHLAAARWRLGAVAGTAETSARISGGTTLVWAGAGLGASGTAANLEATSVQAGGEFAPFKSVSSMGARTGYAFALGGNMLYAFSGLSASDVSAVQGEMCAPGVAGCSTTPAPPDLRTWGGAAIVLTQPRQFAGAATVGAKVHLVGGVAAGGATATTEVVSF